MKQRDERMTQPTNYCSPMVHVLKKATGEACICVDFKMLKKKAVKRQRYLPAITDENTAKLSGATVFLPLHANASSFF